MSTASVETKTDELVIPKGDSSWAIAYRQFKKDKVAVFAFFFLVAVAGVAVFSPVLANSKPLVASYQDGIHFPAFKDYLDETIPIPYLGRWLRKTIPSVFSPKYPEIDRPSWQQVPDWRAIRREIDETGKGWYLLAPVPYYYNEDSSGIKLLPGESLGDLEVRPSGDREAETLTFRPRRPGTQELSKLRARLASGTESRATVTFDDASQSWTVADPTTLALTSLDDTPHWTRADPEILTPWLTRWESVDEDKAAGVVSTWEWREAYLPGEQELEQTPRTGERALQFWGEHTGLKHTFDETRWTTIAGLPTLEAKSTPSAKATERLVGPEATAKTLWLVFAPDRVFSVLVNAPVLRRELKGSYQGPLHAELSQQVRDGLTFTEPLGNTLVNGDPVIGRRSLASGDSVTIGNVKTRFVQHAPFLLGTDSHGRCVLSRLIHGTVIAGSVGIVSVGIYVFIGVILGSLAAYFRGWVDLLISRVIEVVICFPTLFLIIMIAGVLQENSIYLIMVTLGLIRWTGIARLVRGEILKTMSAEYVSAAKALGLPTTRIIFRHILPNSIAPVFVSASFGVAGAILVESSLSFLGFGVAPPTASWGEILRQGKEFVNEGMYHLVWAPGVCIFVTVTMFNLVGEGLRDALDPKLRT